MINFIICEDNEHVREVEESIICKLAMPYDFDYKVYSFDNYNSKLKNIINSSLDLKIYILDIEMPTKTGVDIAREIRKTDWDSIIIISTSHNELEMQILKDKLLIYDFISKFDNYEERLMNSLDTVIKKLNLKKILSFKSNKELHHVKFDNILYVYRDNNTEKTMIVTNDNEYVVRDSISNIIKQLDSRFYQTHRACYVNKEHIKIVDFIKGIIYFDNGKNIDYLSRNYKKGLR